MNSTDLGNAERLVAAYGRDLRYVHAWERWLVWDGRRWRIDDTGEIFRRAALVARRIGRQADEEPGGEDRAQLWKWAMKSEGAPRLKAMVEVARSLKQVVARPEDFDTDGFLLNVANGTLDLRTGVLRPHRREDLITKLAPVAFDPAATCPLWEAVLARVLPSAAVRAFLQRAVGYSLTGDTTAHALFLAYGTGANGKTTVLDTISHMLGDYAKTAEATAFLVKKNDAARNDLAALVGARLVLASETEDGRKMAVALVKQLTGGDSVAVRFLYAEFFDFVPTFKPWIATNYRPVIRGTDEGIWRRVKLIPFTVTIPEAERDPKLVENLRAELPGILWWAMEGCRAWQKDGLQPPSEIRAATKAYRDDMDPLAQWIADACVLDATASAPIGDLYKSYLAWCERNGEEPFKKNTLGSLLQDRGLFPDSGTHGVRVRRGIRLRGDGKEQVQEPPEARLDEHDQAADGWRSGAGGARCGFLDGERSPGGFTDGCATSSTAPQKGVASRVAGNPPEPQRDRQPGEDDE